MRNALRRLIIYFVAYSVVKWIKQSFYLQPFAFKVKSNNEFYECTKLYTTNLQLGTLLFFKTQDFQYYLAFFTKNRSQIITKLR